MSKNGIIPDDRGFVIGHGSANGFREEWLDEAGAGIPEAIIGLERDKAARGFPVVGFLGRLCRQKGLETLAVAWPAIREHFPEARLLIVGPWEREDAVSDSYRRRLEGDSSVIIPGAVEQWGMGQCYRLMDVFLLPSIGSEGMPNTLLESALYGVPAVTSDVVGCIDAVVDGVTGQIVPPGNVDALVRATVTYLRDPALAKFHGNLGRDRVLKDFRPEPIWDRLLDEYCVLNSRDKL